MKHPTPPYNARASRSYQAAITKARQYAKDGPLVSSIVVPLQGRLQYFALPGFIEPDRYFDQIRLITPDGRVWKKEGTL